MPKTLNDDISFSLAYNLKGLAAHVGKPAFGKQSFHEVFPHERRRPRRLVAARAPAPTTTPILKKCGAANVRLP